MLTLTELTALERSLRNTRVLSVYLSTRTQDPSRRKAWRPLYGAALRACESRMEGASRDERAEFAAARDAVEQALLEARRVETHGVACFAAAGGILRMEPLPFPIETTVAWGLGPALAPMVRALKEERPALLAVLDGKSAVLHRYQFESLTEVDSLSVDPRSVDVSHAPARVSPRFHQGVRGTSGQDEAQHDWAAAADRLVRDVVHRIAVHAGQDGWVLVGGRRNVVQRVMTLLAPGLRPRAGRLDGVSKRTSRADLMAAVRSAASQLRNAADGAALDQLADRATVDASAMGDVAVRRTLEQARVQDLFVTSRYVKEHAADAEAAVRAALEQGARVETVSGEASVRLDALGGIAARLRYGWRPNGATASGHPAA